MNTAHEQAIARLMGEDLWVWSSYPRFGVGRSYEHVNGSGFGYGYGDGSGYGDSSGYGHGSGYGIAYGYSSGNGTSRES
jgi:hypothetical protein